jgi:60 kDa SS-A/Ro ribonucleoprotein
MWRFSVCQRKDKSMATINKTVRKTPIYTHEGAKAQHINPELQLRRSVMACMLWESTFYEDGESIAKRIADLVPQVKPHLVSNMAIEARNQMKLRHVPLLLVREMARHESHKSYVASTLFQVVQRADELAEFVSIYWKDGRQTLSAQVKKGLAQAFKKFNAYQLAKYNRDNAVKLRDVLFLVHAKPDNDEQAETWKKLVDGTLESPDTWEVELSAGKDKRETWTRLISENKLGALAFLRNLRNMKDAGVNEKLIFSGLSEMKTERVLPFRFISAAKYAPQWEDKIEPVMLKCIEVKSKLKGKTVLLVDVSGSMDAQISGKSELKRWEVAAGLSILAREMCESVQVYIFSNNVALVPARHGFALRDVIGKAVGGGTNTGDAVYKINASETYDRLIIFTDEQSHQSIPNPTGKGYVVNVASEKNGIGYGAWNHIDGWSEAVLDYIQASEE